MSQFWQTQFIETVENNINQNKKINADLILKKQELITSHPKALNTLL